MNERSEIGRKRETQVENLELNKETLQDLTEAESEGVEGGLAGPTASESCKLWCGSRIERVGC